MSQVSIAIPTHDRREYLLDAIGSILSQSVVDFEVFIFDNASNYDIETLINDFSDKRIKLIKSDINLGSFDNFKRIFKYQFSSEYLVVFHDDDVMHPTLLERELVAIESDQSISWVGSGINFAASPEKMFEFKEAKNAYEILDVYDLSRILLTGFNLGFSTVMYRTKFLSEIDLVKLMDDYFKWWDRPFLINLAEGHRVAIIKDRLVNYRLHPGQDSQAEARDRLDSIFKLEQLYFDKLPKPLSLSDERLYCNATTNALVLSGISFSDSWTDYWNFIQDARRRGFFKWQYLNLKGVYYFIIALRRLAEKRKNVK